MTSFITGIAGEIKHDFLDNLEECSEESIYAPGFIQPQGLIFILRERGLNILQVSENAGEILGIGAEELIDKPLEKFFSPAQVEKITGWLEQGGIESCKRFELKTVEGENNDRRTFTGALYQIEKALILELEPRSTGKKEIESLPYSELQRIILKMRSAADFQQLTEIIVREMKVLTGYDRVMVYRFEEDQHGTVIAEEKESRLDSYLGSHYPATDIPKASRKLLYRNWLRVIPDVSREQVRLIPPEREDLKTPIDQSDCLLRGIHQAHVEYLKNMGVVSSLTVSLIDGKKVWGLIACHNYSPKEIDRDTRDLCELVGQFASIELVHQQDRESSLYRAKVKEIQEELQRSFRRESNFIERVLNCHDRQLLELVNATGVAISIDGNLSLIGITPTEEEIRELIGQLKRQDNTSYSNKRVFATNRLSRMYPAAKRFKDKASGLLALSIFLHRITEKSYHIIWFRPEQIQTVDWAGKLADTIEIDESGKVVLCPRRSFQLWRDTVEETCQPWRTIEIEAAAEMRDTLMLAVLEFSQAALERAAEQAAIASRAKSQFLAKMSHELRTPLNAILGFTQIMSHDSDISSDFQEYLGIINRSGEHLLTLIDDVLEMSKIEAGQLVLNETCFDIFRLIRSLEELFALKASEKGLNLEIQKESEVCRYVCGDEAKLRQILINLLGNAIKFTTEGSVTLRVSATPVEKERGKKSLELRLQVEDTGCGIAPEEQETIFEAFRQTERGRHVQGTGLGLSISRQFARLMGGDITVRSIPERGSVFTCRVIVHLPESIDIVETDVTRSVIGLEPGQPLYRLLVAEDVLETGQLMSILLKSIGFEVKVVQNGAEALENWRSWQPHLIFMDIQMPVMDGHEATAKIRSIELEERRERTPIVALTAYAFEEDRLVSSEVGCDHHIAKPFTETKIFDAISRYLGVRYRYREENISFCPSPVEKSLVSEDLKIMPAEWIEKVHKAALALNDEKLSELIALIPESEKSLKEKMLFLLENFQLETIFHLTES